MKLNEKNDTIPTLMQVLELCSGKIRVNIELKGENCDLPRKVLEVVKQTDTQS